MTLQAPSLGARTIIYVLITSLVMMCLIVTLIFSQVTQLTDKLTERQLLEQAQRLASFIEYNWLGKFDLDVPRDYADYYADKDAHHQYAVFDAQNKLLYKSPTFMMDRIKDTLDKGGKHYFDFKTEEGLDYKGVKYDYLFEGRIYPIYVIEYEDVFSEFIKDVKNNFQSNLIFLVGPLLLLQALFIILIFNISLRPLIRASKNAKKITYNNLSYRINTTKIPNEMLPLVESINEGLERLEESADTQKMFIANASHEIRTPITILKTRLSSLPEDIRNREEVALLHQDLREIDRLITQMLSISRLNLPNETAQEDVDLNEIARNACAEIAPMFIKEGREISLKAEEASQIIKGDKEMLYRAVINLLENAHKHADAQKPVEIIVAGFKLIVRDYGTPIPEDEHQKIFEKFSKSSNNKNKKGSGLGLSIVKKTVLRHGGDIHVIAREDGNDFVMDFSQLS